MAKITVQAARMSKGWTQEELAKRMGTSRETIVAFEKDPMKMKPFYFYAFLHVTGFNAEDILLPEKSIKNELIEE